MATVLWVGNGQDRAGVTLATVTAVAAGGTLSATINGKTLTYTVVTGDTLATAAAGLLAVLQATDVPVEFSVAADYSASGAAVTATAAVAGVPFFGMTGGLVFSASGGTTTLTQTTVTTSLSKSDVGLAANWLRAGTPAIPVNGDDVVVADSSTPLLYNLTALAAVQFLTYTRSNSFTAAVGLPRTNAAGYLEYLPTYIQFTSAGTVTLLLGADEGTGPTLEKYDLGATAANFRVLSSGGPVLLLGTNVANTLQVVGAAVGVAALPTEVSALASATVDGGGTLQLGPGVSFGGALVFYSGTGVLACVLAGPATLTSLNGSGVTVTSTGSAYLSVTGRGGSSFVWLSDSTVTTLVLETGTTFDKSSDVRPMTVTNSTIDGDTCQVIDPNNSITFTNATSVKQRVQQGPFVFTGTRTVKVT